MTKNKLFIFEKLLFAGVLLGTLSGFWYFESSMPIKISATILMLTGLFMSFKKSRNQSSLLNSRFEMLSLLTVYLGVFTLYNFIYIVNFPIYIVMAMILILVTVTAFTTLAMDGVDESLSKEIFYSFILLMGLIITEVFLSLYFWPINVEIKSLVLVVVFYQIMTLIYLYVRSMLRLNKIAGFLIVNFLILAIVFWSLWPKMPR